MKIVIALFFSVMPLLSLAMERTGLSSCRSINPNADGQRVQSLQSVAAGSESGRTESDTANYGDDIVYEGAPCPNEKICIESIFSVYGNASLLHSGVFVIDKKTGLLENLAPLRVLDPDGQSSLSINERGIPLKDPSRWDRACSNIISNFKGPYNLETPNPNPCEAEKRAGATPVIDISYYGGSRSTGRISTFYKQYTIIEQDAKNRAIEMINDRAGLRHNWMSFGSLAQSGANGTFGRISKLVGAVRRGLGCEPLPNSPDDRVAALIFAQRDELKECGFQLDTRSLELSTGTPRRFTLGNPENLRVDVPRAGKLFKDIKHNVGVIESLIEDCVSVQLSPEVETITCDNGPLAPVDPRARNDRERGLARGRSEPSYRDIPVGSPRKPHAKLTIRVVNGRIESLEGERNFTYLTDEKVSCNPVPRPAGASQTGGDSGSVIRQ